MNLKIKVFLTTSFLLLTLVPLASFAQTYEGETDKKGLPNGKGTMHFESSIKIGTQTIDCVEKLEGTFKKGEPISGRSYRYSKSDGRKRMEFIGTFKLKQKGVLNSLSDLDATGSITYYKYEEDEKYKDYGYQKLDGRCDNGITNISSLTSSKTGWIYKVTNNRISKGVKQASDLLPSDCKKEFNPLIKEYFYDLTKEEGALSLDKLKSAEANFIGPLNKGIYNYHVMWSGNTVDGVIDGNGYGIAYNEDEVISSRKKIFYFQGEFKHGLPVSDYSYKAVDEDRNNTIKTFEVKIEDKNNGFYFYRINTNCYNPTLGLSFNLYNSWRSHVISETPIVKNIEARNTFPLSVTPFKDDIAIVSVKYAERTYTPVILQYQIDKGGRYMGLTPQNFDVIQCYMDSIKIYRDILLKPFNPADLKNLNSSLRKYGFDNKKHENINGIYYNLCRYVLPNLGEDCKAKVNAFKDVKDDVTDIEIIYHRLTEEFSWMYTSWTQSELVRQYKNKTELFDMALNSVDDLLKKSLITQDAARVAKEGINKKKNEFEVVYKDVWGQISRQVDAAYEARRTKNAKIATQRCKAPSGELVNGLFGGMYHHAKNGYIYFTDGESAQYNAFYDEYSKKFLKYTISNYPFYKKMKKSEFETYEEMINELISSRKK